MSRKPLGRKNYGSIPHLPNSRLGIGDHKCSEGQARIATLKTRDKHDEVIVQEKLDGSNVGVARIKDEIYALTRAGYIATSSPFEQHHYFHDWVKQNAERFMAVLNNGERLVGEWLMQAHSTRYDLSGLEPFVAFDLMTEDKRIPYDDFIKRIANVSFSTPQLLHRGGALSVVDALELLQTFGFYGAMDEVEGAVWRIERNKPTGKKGGKERVVDYLVKYVRPEKKDGIFLPEISGKKPFWNWLP